MVVILLVSPPPLNGSPGSANVVEGRPPIRPLLPNHLSAVGSSPKRPNRRRSTIVSIVSASTPAPSSTLQHHNHQFNSNDSQSLLSQCEKSHSFRQRRRRLPKATNTNPPNSTTTTSQPVNSQCHTSNNQPTTTKTTNTTQNPQQLPKSASVWIKSTTNATHKTPTRSTSLIDGRRRDGQQPFVRHITRVNFTDDVVCSQINGQGDDSANGDVEPIVKEGE